MKLEDKAPELTHLSSFSINFLVAKELSCVCEPCNLGLVEEVYHFFTVP